MLPFTQEYLRSGAFTVREKLIRSLIVNAVIYGTMAVIGIAFIIYLGVENGLYAFERKLILFEV